MTLKSIGFLLMYQNHLNDITYMYIYYIYKCLEKVVCIYVLYIDFFIVHVTCMYTYMYDYLCVSNYQELPAFQTSLPKTNFWISQNDAMF